MDFILASASPRRREILSLAGYTFEVVTSDVDESLAEGTTPEEAVMQLAQRKAEAVAALRPSDTIVSADTVVYCDGRILGKPADEADAFDMLRMLSGRSHEVYTGVCILRCGQPVAFYEKTSVTFWDVTDGEIRSYIATGEPMDKAGAYAIQGRSCVFIKCISGDYYNVVGFPVARFARELKEL